MIGADFLKTPLRRQDSDDTYIDVGSDCIVTLIGTIPSLVDIASCRKQTSERDHALVHC